MSEWEEKLNTLLSDPDAMAQVMNRRLPLHHRRRAIRWAIFRRCSAALTPA